MITPEQASIDLKTVERLLRCACPGSQTESILKAFGEAFAYAQYESGVSALTPHGYKHQYEIVDKTQQENNHREETRSRGSHDHAAATHPPIKPEDSTEG